MGAFELSFMLWALSPFRANLQPAPPSIWTTLFVGLTFVTIFFSLDTYTKNAEVVDIRVQLSIVKAILVGCMVLILASFFVRSFFLSRLQTVYFLILAFILVLAERFIFYRINLFYLKAGVGVRRVLIYGAGAVGTRLAKGLLKYPKWGYLPVGFIDDFQNGDVKVGNPISIIGHSSDLADLAVQYGIDELLIAIPSAGNDRIQWIMDQCAAIGLRFRYVPNLYDIAIQKVRTDVIDGIPVFSIGHLHYRPLNAFIKRVMDMALSGLVLLLLLPLILLISLIIKLDSKGPAFFKQERVGKAGMRFRMVKFRTMFVDAPAYEVHPQDRRDPRITRAGWLLRRTSLDELPQFWNVLKGDMSIVGPRPEMEFIVNEYDELQRERLNVKPGITGLWQISADRALPIHENIDHDLFYIQNQSPLLDIVIIFKTIWVAMFGIGGK
ncbi:MAG: sugar transferase [Acholeplasmataceae bacterium]|nr:sugar transferase [Acholeplasmataceae bacterium]